MTTLLKGRILVYSVVGCPHCMRAKNTLKELDLPYMDINLESFPQCRSYVKERTGKTTVPQIFFNSTHIGGNEDLQKLVADRSELNKLIDELKTREPGDDAPEIPDPSTAKDTGDRGEFVCEPDEYALLVQELKKSGLIRDHRSGLRSFKNSFSGKAFVDWVVSNKGLDRERAVEMGQSLIDQHFGHHVKEEQSFRDDNSYYRLIEDDESTALNAGATSSCQPRPVNEIGEEIRRLILKIYSVFLSEDGKKVNYSGIKASSEFGVYKRLSRELVRVRIEDASREEKIAFFVNIYNALVIHANIERGPPTTLWQRYKFFNTVTYIIGGQTYSLQDIENGVLRANRKGVGMLSRPFGKSDPRLSVALEKPEPLVHFALVCGAKSCPPIKTFSAQGIDEQLQLAAESFLEADDALQVIMQKKEVKLSMIFKWYREDFANSNEEVVRVLHGLMAEGDKKNQLGELMAGGKFQVSHMSYDWGTNS